MHRRFRLSHLLILFSSVGAISAVAVAVAVGGPGDVAPADALLPVIDWKDAPRFVGQTVIVQGRVTQTRNIGAICFLNFDSGRSFAGVVRKANFSNFPNAPEQMYRDKIVRIRGVISRFRGSTQIEFHRPDDIRILEHDEPVTSQPASGPTSQPTSRPSVPANGVVTVATYNVLNFFDAYDDPYHEDEGTPAKPLEQLKNLAASIRALNADVLAVEEVENRDYLERYVKSMLGDMGYVNVVGFESNDTRGIQCCVLSRLPVGPVTSHRFMDFDDGRGGKMRFRRDLIEVRVEPPGFEPFDVFAVHLKSKRGGAEATASDRNAEARAVRLILDQVLSANRTARFLICGDFNDTWESATLKTIRGEGPSSLTDFMADLPPGCRSFNQSAHAEVIDFILSSPALGRCYIPHSYRIIPGSVPTTGSDHNPVVMQFRLGCGQ